MKQSVLTERAAEHANGDKRSLTLSNHTCIRGIKEMPLESGSFQDAPVMAKSKINASDRITVPCRTPVWTVCTTKT